MKHSNLTIMKSAFFAITVLLSLPSLAQTKKSAASVKKVDVSKDVDTLGGNKALLDMAASMDPENRARVVQNRLVDRRNRLELGLNYGAVAGGDSYLRTQNMGAAADFHFTPRFSLGVRYYDYGNDLTPQGKRVFEEATAAHNAGGLDYTIPLVDAPLNSVLGVVSWYPVYGKTNLMNWGIAQFDMYLLAGGGQITLSSGPTGLATAGAGVGFWVSQHFSIRTEIRYQNYRDQAYIESRNLNTVTGQIGLGILL
jgi:outer membrane immunogenic protein